MAFARLHYIFMFNNDQLKELVKKAREATPKRNFAQSAEITLVLKDIDVKKGFSVNEIVVLPNPAKKAGVDQVMEPDTLDRIGTNRREARKIVRSYDFFLADATLMSSVGRSLGQFLGPKGKMPTPVPYGAPIENIASRLRSSTRIRSRNQLNISTKIGDEKMDDKQLIQNANTILSLLEKK